MVRLPAIIVNTYRATAKPLLPKVTLSTSEGHVLSASAKTLMRIAKIAVHAAKTIVAVTGMCVFVSSARDLG